MWNQLVLTRGAAHQGDVLGMIAVVRSPRVEGTLRQTPASWAALQIVHTDHHLGNFVLHLRECGSRNHLTVGPVGVAQPATDSSGKWKANNCCCFQAKEWRNSAKSIEVPLVHWVGGNMSHTWPFRLVCLWNRRPCTQCRTAEWVGFLPGELRPGIFQARMHRDILSASFADSLLYEIGPPYVSTCKVWKQCDDSVRIFAHIFASLNDLCVLIAVFEMNRSEFVRVDRSRNRKNSNDKRTCTKSRQNVSFFSEFKTQSNFSLPWRLYIYKKLHYNISCLLHKTPSHERAQIAHLSPAV